MRLEKIKKMLILDSIDKKQAKKQSKRENLNVRKLLKCTLEVPAVWAEIVDCRAETVNSLLSRSAENKLRLFW